MEKGEKIILVTGATGRQGGAVVRHLLDEGWKVRALTRNPQKEVCESLREKGVEVVEGDLNLPDSLTGPLTGVYGVFAVMQPLEHGVESEVFQGKSLIDKAKEGGVHHFVYSSIGSADKKTGIPFFDSKAQIEDYLRDSGLSFTIVRPVYFMDQFMSTPMREKIMDGELYFPLGAEIPLQLVSVDDIGKFVAHLFGKPEEFSSVEIDIAGDELTGPQIAALFSNALGRPVRFREQPLEEVRAQGADFAMMYDWLRLRGFNADISEVQKKVHDIDSLETWIDKSGFHKAAA